MISTDRLLKSETAYLPQQAVVLLMNADRVLDRDRLSGVVRHLAVEVVDAAEAITSELEGVGCKERGQAELVPNSSSGVSRRCHIDDAPSNRPTQAA